MKYLPCFVAQWLFECLNEFCVHTRGIYYARVTAGIEKGKPQRSWDIFKSENWNLLIPWNGTILDWYSGKITQLGWSHFLLYTLLSETHASVFQSHGVEYMPSGNTLIQGLNLLFNSIFNKCPGILAAASRFDFSDLDSINFSFPWFRE